MRQSNRNTLLASVIAGTALTGSACDPVRDSQYQGTFPSPVRFEVPQLPDQLASAGQPHDLTISLWDRVYQPSRQWTPAVAEELQGSHNDSNAAYRPPSTLGNVWEVLAADLDIVASKRMLAPTAPILVAGTLRVDVSPEIPTTGSASAAADVNHVLFVSTQDIDMQPIGPAGPTVQVPRGFHIFQRACTSDGSQSFTEVPLDTVLQTVPVPALNGAAVTPDPFAATCGIDTGATIDLGSVAAPIPADYAQEIGSLHQLLQVTGLAWQPDSTGFYVVAERPDVATTNEVTPPGAQILHLALGDSMPSVITTDDVSAPLAVATGGMSLLVWAQRGNEWRYVEQALPGTALPVQTVIPAAWFPAAPPVTSLSPDGNVLAGPDLTFVDLRTNASSAISLPAPDTGSPPSLWIFAPQAWSPDGTQLLLESWPQYTPGTGSTCLSVDGQCIHSYAIVPVVYTGSLPTSAGTTQQLPSDGIPPALSASQTDLAYDPAAANIRFFWPAAGPQALIQDADGARVYDFTTQQEVPLVEPNRVAQPSAPIDVVTQTAQAFAWAVQCFGLGETECRAELRRLSLATGVVDVVATADQPRLFAVSPDGAHIAFADDTNLRVKDLAP